MSKLFFSETGRVLYLENEEITHRRHVRKIFRLPSAIRGDATLFILAKSRPGGRRPLHVRVNGQRRLSLRPDHHYYLSWFTLRLKGGDLRPGRNVMELWCDTDAMDGWMLGLEPATRAPDSALSLDGGRTWRRDHMGVHHCLRGEYVLRLRLDDPALSDPPPPPMAWEHPECPHFEPLRAALPRRVARIADPWRRARALATWVSAQWSYAADRDSPVYRHSEYCPWDPLTILAWRKADLGQYQSNPVAFCVHYGAAYVPLALALGIPARCVCGTPGTLAREFGHFVAEVWIEKWRKWCYVDPMCDFAFVRDGVPLSTAEIAREPAPKRRGWLSRGPGLDGRPAAVRKAFTAAFGAGGCFRRWAVWPRNDFLAHPELTPPSHGATFYCETDWLWAKSARDEGMFPRHVPEKSLAAPPPARWRSARR
jgi:hypothetical protein